MSRSGSRIESLESRTLLTDLDLALLPNSSGVLLVDNFGGDRTGSAVTSVGDLDGDGFDDVLVTAPGAYGQKGAMVVVFGGHGLPSVLDVRNLGLFGMTIVGVDPGDGTGISASAAGDVNGDGFDDMIIGSPYASSIGNTRYQAGESYIIYGDSNLPQVLDLFFLGNRGTVIFGANPGDLSGSAVSNAGDVDRDGFDDVLIGAPHGDGQGNGRNNSGEAYLIYGGNSMPLAIDLLNLGSDGVALYGVSNYDSLGYAVSSTGDIDGDGFDDFVLGAEYADGLSGNRQNSGETYVIFGGTGLPQTIDLASLGGLGFTIFGAETNDYSGTAVSSAGDFDGDGFADFILTAPFADAPGNTQTNAGESYLIFGGPGVGSDIDLSSLGNLGSTLYGAQSADLSGRSVRLAGDINADGFDDLIIGAPNTFGIYNGRAYSGESYVVFGTPTPQAFVDLGSLSDSRGMTIFGVNPGDASGSWVSGAGDIDGDGFDDLVIGAYAAQGTYNNQTKAGEAYIIYGDDFTGAVTLQGSNSSNTLTGTTGADVINGADGNDILLGNGGADVLIGGRGDDVLAISTLDFQRIDGGNGSDTLRFDGAGLNLDLITVGDTLLSSLETIDIRGSGANSLTLDYYDVVILTENSNPNHFADVLLIRRDLDDTVNIGAGWTADGTDTFNGVLYDVFVQGSAVVGIQNTDPSVSLSLTPGPIAEAGGVATVTATLSAISAEDVTVNLGFTGTATSPADYTASGTQIVIPAGSLTGTITLTAVQDGAFEGTETIIVDITSVTNGLESTPQQVTAQIADDDTAPVFTSTATPSVPENQASVMTVVATDSDVPPQTITYSITGGADAGLFTITPTGDLSFISGRDFENPTDANIDNVYVVQVTANDGQGGVTTQTLSVTVTNVAEDVEISVGGGPVTYIKRQPPILVLPQATVGGTSLGGGQLVLDVNVVATRTKLLDQYFIPAISSIGSSSGPQLVSGHLILTIDLDPGVTAASIQSFLRGITFSTRGKGLKTPTRTLHLTLTNSLSQSAETTQTINVLRKA